MTKKTAQRQRNWFFFQQREDQELERLSFTEFISAPIFYGKDDFLPQKQKDEKWEQLKGTDPQNNLQEPFYTERNIRLMVFGFLLTVVVMLIACILTLARESDVRGHRCEEIYHLYYLVQLDAWGLGAVLVLYTIVMNINVFVAVSWVTMLATCLYFLWSVGVWSNMHSSCNSFYEIVYPALYNWWFGLMWAHLALLLGMVGFQYWSWLNFDPSRAPKERRGWQVEAPAISTNIFFKKDKLWTPAIFEDSDVRAYKKGVEGWNTAAQERLARLRMTLDNAEKVSEVANKQSQALGKVSTQIDETVEKTTQISGSLDEQEKLIADFTSDVNKVADQLETMTVGKGSYFQSFHLCTTCDLCWWLYVWIGLIGIYILFSLATDKWFALFGFSSPVPLLSVPLGPGVTVESAESVLAQ